jgi:hypothetical protein
MDSILKTCCYLIDEKITSGVLYSLLNLLYDRNNEMLASKNVLNRISIYSVEWTELNNQFMALCKIGFITDQYGCKTVLCDNAWLKYAISNFSSFRKRFMKP